MTRPIPDRASITAMTRPCLHCMIVEAICGHFDDLGESANGGTRLDATEIMESTGQAAAEFIASHPDKRERDRLLREFHHAVRDAIPTIRARGEGHFPKLLRPH